MTAHHTRRAAYWLAALLAIGYLIYVVVTKFMSLQGRGPLGDLGEAALVLASVTAFSIGLFADERVHDKTPGEVP